MIVLKTKNVRYFVDFFNYFIRHFVVIPERKDMILVLSMLMPDMSKKTKILTKHMYKL